MNKRILAITFIYVCSAVAWIILAGAIRALGTLGDPKAIPIVETFSGDDPDDHLQRSAKNALKALREKKELVPEEIVQLLETVDKIRKENEKLRNDVDDIKSGLMQKIRVKRVKKTRRMNNTNRS